MEKLKELVSIVSRIKTHKVEIIGRGRLKKGQKLKALYDGIAQGKFKSDQEAAMAIYGTDERHTNYTSLKHNLTNHLLNTIFFINHSEYKFNDFQRVLIDAHKLRAIIHILMGRGSRRSGVELAEKLIYKALKYQLTQINFELAKILRLHYRVFDYKAARAKKYDAIVKEQFSILEAETEVEDYYEQIIQELKNKRSSKNKLAEKTKEIASRVKAIFPKVESYKLAQYAQLIFVMEHEFSNDFEAVETTCQKAIEYYEGKGILGSSEKALIFSIKLLSVYIPLKKFKEGEAVAIKILASILPESINYFITLEHYFLLSMHTKNYDKAQEVLIRAKESKGFKKLLPYYLEMWWIYEAYIEYLKEAGILQKASTKKFRIARFINEVPNFSKDKTGVNISILVIQILLLIAQDKETRVIDRMEALRSYVYTHLRNDESLRSNLFIKMLLKMVESNFHKNGTIRRTKSLRKKLEASPIGTKGYSQYVEIIPYETLWEISLGFLSNRAF